MPFRFFDLRMPIPSYVDSHAHLHYLVERIPKYKKLLKSDSLHPLADAINALRLDLPAEFEAAVEVLCDPSSLSSSASNPVWLQIADHVPFVYLSAGLHPVSSAHYSPLFESDLLTVLAHPRCIALGEIGLDLHNEFAPDVAVQTAALEAQLAVYKRAGAGRPIVLHLRGGEALALDILKRCVDSEARMHAHCFTGSAEEALALSGVFPNMMFGITGAIAGKNEESERMRSVVQFMSMEKLLIETDAPYLTLKYEDDPEKKKAAKAFKGSSHPGMIPDLCLIIAKIKEMTVEDVLLIA
ncbi:putative deoxyribonuclease tatdn2, partial [Nowakowskiella sp. JEL0078]